MTMTAREKLAERAGIDPEVVRVGKDVIEILTSGMYVSPVTVYREYVQNAADAIDEARATGLIGAGRRGKVSITFDHAARSATVRDTGAGIRVRDAAAVLVAIGASPKREAQVRGFRGVGRLSGLAYCRELEFKTKAAGDTQSISVTWDCQLLRQHLADGAFSGDLRQIVSDVVSVRHEKADRPDDHFFEVRLHGLARLRNDLLLNERSLIQYLGQVAPLPFAPEFTFASQIERELSQFSRTPPLDLTVAGEAVLRPYRDEMTFPGTGHSLRINEIEFLHFANVDGETGAFGWLGHHQYVRSIPPTLGVRGLRARHGDLQIGDANLFDEFFKEPRFNGWCVGEIHVSDRRIVPNARRDNFELNHHYYNFLVQLGPVTLNISKHCRSASVARNATQIVRNVIADVAARLKQNRRFDRAELSRMKSSVLRATSKASRITDVRLRKSYVSRLERLKTALQKVTPKRGASIVAYDEAVALVGKVITNREQARRLIDALRRLCD
jgi:hypothetical protein